MIHQLRIYEIFEHSKAAFHDRFRDHAARIVYLLAWPNEGKKNAAWARFLADEEWKEIKRVTSAKATAYAPSRL